MPDSQTSQSWLKEYLERIHQFSPDPAGVGLVEVCANIFSEAVQEKYHLSNEDEFNEIATVAQYFLDKDDSGKSAKLLTKLLVGVGVSVEDAEKRKADEIVKVFQEWTKYMRRLSDFLDQDDHENYDYEGIKDFILDYSRFLKDKLDLERGDLEFALKNRLDKIHKRQTEFNQRIDGEQTKLSERIFASKEARQEAQKEQGGRVIDLAHYRETKNPRKI